MTPALSLIVAEEGGHPVVNELPLPPIMYGVIAMVAFLALLGVLWAFRNTLALDPHGVTEGHSNPDAARGGTGH